MSSPRWSSEGGFARYLKGKIEQIHLTIEQPLLDGAAARRRPRDADRTHADRAHADRAHADGRRRRHGPGSTTNRCISAQS
jgi:hypothetical protein